MTRDGDRQEWIPGYEAPIKRALWERILTGGVPRVWGALWLCVCLYAGLLTMVAFGFLSLLIPALVWLLGHGALIGLTLFDTHWDEMAIAQLTRRYKSYYDAG